LSRRPCDLALWSCTLSARRIARCRNSFIKVKIERTGISLDSVKYMLCKVMPMVQQNKELRRSDEQVLAEMKVYYSRLPFPRYKQFWTTFGTRHDRVRSFLRGFFNYPVLADRPHFASSWHEAGSSLEDWQMVGKDLYDAVESYQVAQRCAASPTPPHSESPATGTKAR